jgi:hypothetical protein
MSALSDFLENDVLELLNSLRSHVDLVCSRESPCFEN